MTARNGRVVRVGPGATSDRRGPATNPSQPLNSPARIPAKTAVPKDPPSIGPRIPDPPPIVTMSRGIARERRRSRRSHPLPLESGPTIFDSVSLVDQLVRHRGSLELKLLLHMEAKNGVPGLTPSRIRGKIRLGQEAIDGALGCLTRLSLVSQEADDAFPFGVRCRLTSRGEKLVSLPMPSWSMAFL